MKQKQWLRDQSLLYTLDERGVNESWALFQGANPCQNAQRFRDAISNDIANELAQTLSDFMKLNAKNGYEFESNESEWFVRANNLLARFYESKQ